MLVLLVAVLVTVVRPQAAGSATTCTTAQLVPALGDVEITQGAPGYAKLARGKETLVKFFLTKPTVCTMGSTQAITITGATLDVNNSARTFTGVAAFQSFTAAPAVSNATVAVNSAADPIFPVSADKLTPIDANGTPLTSFTPSFTVHLTFTKKNGTTTTTGQTVAYTNSTTQAKTFDRESRALRVLVVPMGDGTPGIAANQQFTSTDQQSTVNGLATLNRILPTPTGLASLGGSSGGLRYTMDLATLINLKDPTVPTSAYVNGKFCGSAVNWSAIKGLLERYLEAWNTATDLTTGALINPPADRVLGVVGEGISSGYQASCAEGMASLSSRAAWVRAISDKPASGRTAAQPSMTGALMAMEMQHTWGMVPSPRSSTTHSGNVQADGAKPDRAYNVAQRAYVQNDHSAMDFDTTISPPWNNDNTFDEPADFAYSLCALGGTTPSPFNNECAAGANAPGTLMGVQAGPGLVASGTTDGTAGGTSVLWSQAVPGATQLTAGDPQSLFRYVRRVSATNSTIVTDFGFPVSFTGDAHGSSAGEDYTSTVGQFGFALPDSIPAPGQDLARIQIWKLNTGIAPAADPNTSNATLLYQRDQQTSPPQLGSTITVTDAATPQNFTKDPTRDDTEPAISRDGQWMAWTQGPQGSTGTCDGPCHFVVVERTSGGEVIPLPDLGQETRDAAWGPVQGDGTLPLAFIASADANVDEVLFDPVTDTFSDPTVLFDGDIEGLTPSHPSFSRNGNAIAFAANGNIYRVPTSGGNPTQLTTTGDASAPTWSQTSGDDRIAFVRRPDTNIPASTSRISDATDGTNGNALSAPSSRSVSDNGRFVAFVSDATNLVAGDTNGIRDIFVRDRKTGTTERADVSSAGAQATTAFSGTDGVSMTPDGRFVSFHTPADNLVNGDTGGIDVFVHDRTTGDTELMSMTGDGTKANGNSFWGSMSSDGRYVAFYSSASNLAGAQGNATSLWNVYVHDRDADGNGVFDEPGQTATKRLTLDTNGADPDGGSFTGSASISADGRFVAFQSQASDLVANDTNGAADVFVYDRDSDQNGVFDEAGGTSIRRVSLTTASGEANGLSSSPVISANGNWVAFRSQATNMDGDTNGGVFLAWNGGGPVEVTRISVQGGNPALDESGNLVAFNAQSGQVVLHNVETNTDEVVSRDSSGTQGNGFSSNPSLSSDGRFVSFSSDATNLAGTDTNGVTDVFLRDRGGAGGTGGPDIYTLSADGSGSPQLLVSNADRPFWDANGNVVFDQAGNVWTVKSDGTGATQTFTNGFYASTANGFTAFDRQFGDGEIGIQTDVMLARPAAPGQKTVSWQASGPGVENFVSALYLQCGSYSFPVNPHVLPSQTAQAVATFETNFDTSNACGGSTGGTLCVTVTNGVQTAGCGATDPSAPAGSTPKPPRAAILAPAETTYRPDATLSLLGNGYDADNAVLDGSHLSWSLDRGLTIPGSNSGNALDVKPPAGGWPYGYITITLTATDGGGQTATATRRVQIIYDLVGGGFLSPVNNPPAYNTSNAGKNIPLKWQLRDVRGNYIRDISTVKAVEYQPAGPGCNFANPTSPTTALPTGGTFLRYDTKTEQFIYNWATPSTPGCYVFTLTLKDDTQHQAYFKLT